MAKVKLSEGALNSIMQGEDVKDPVLQYMGHKKLNNADRYRLLINDGLEVNSFAMLSPQINHFITDGILTEFSIIKITKLAISMVNNNGQQRRVMVILNLEVLVQGNEIGEQIGSAAPTTASIPKEDTKRLEKPVVPAFSNQNRSSAAPKLNSSLINGDAPNVTPIAALTPYQNKWVIKARVMSKGDKRSWSNSKGEGTLFSMDLCDESGEIRCTAFRQQCEKYYDMIEMGKVYYISRATLKPANKQYSSLKNDYEMTLGNESEIIPCNDDTNDIPTIKYDFVPINQIEQKEVGNVLDVLGIVKSVSDVQNLTSRASGKELKKRDVSIMDQSSTMITLTLWGQQAENFVGDDNPILAAKGVRVGEFQGGKSLSSLNSSVLQVDPDLPEAHKLRGWYSAVGCNEDVTNISKGSGGAGGPAPWLNLQEAKDLRYGQNNEPSVYQAKCTVNFIKSENCMYKACPSEGCKKKVIDHANGMYRCEKCDREYPNFKYRLIAAMSLSDWSGNQWVTAFTDEAEMILGGTSEELGEMKDNDPNMFTEKIAEAGLKSYVFKLKVKLENFSDELRLKTTILAVAPINYKVYNAHLLSKIRELAGIGKA